MYVLRRHKLNNAVDKTAHYVQCRRPIRRTLGCIGSLTLYLYRDRYRLMETVQFWTVRFHETSLLILSLLIILDYFILICTEYVPTIFTTITVKTVFQNVTLRERVPLVSVKSTFSL